MPARRKLNPSQRFDRLKKAVERFERHLEKTSDRNLWEHQNSAMTSVALFLNGALEKIGSGQTASGGIVMPTGSGKTVLAAEIAKAFGVRALVLAPTVQIVLQHYEELLERGPEVKASLYYSDQKDLSGRIIISTYQSVVSLFKSGVLPKNIDIIFYDEAHRSLSQKRSELHGRIAPIEIGLTATPAFNSKKHIWTAFDEVICKMDIREAVELGILSPLRAFVVETNVNLENVKLRLGKEYLNEAEAEKHLNVLARNRSARDFYIDGFKGVGAVAFCITKKHTEEFAAYLKASKVKATFVHGGLSNKERTRRLNAFENGDIDVITSRDVLIEGWDSKRVVLELNLRPTYSRVIKEHMVGRVTRLRPGKEAGIIAEFQDVYERGQQPVLVHHLFDELTYRQGGFVAAPPGKRKEEEEKLKKGKKIHVLGKLSISHKIKKVVSLDQTDVDFYDKKLLRQILATRNDVDIPRLSYTEFFKLKFSHPLFHGVGLTLIHKVFGIRHGASTPFQQKQDFQNFINYAYEDMPPTGDSRVRFTEDIVGFTFGDGKHLMPLDEHDPYYKQKVRDSLQRLQPREERVLKMRFGIDVPGTKTFGEIADDFEVTPERIRQLELRALRRLRCPPCANMLRPFHYTDRYYGNVEKLRELIEQSHGKPHIRKIAWIRLMETYISYDRFDDFYTLIVCSDEAYPYRFREEKGLWLVGYLEQSPHRDWVVKVLSEMSEDVRFPKTVRKSAKAALEKM